MVEATIKCPKCEHQFTVNGNSGEQIFVTCPNCSTYGKYSFPMQKIQPNKLDCFTSLGEKCFTRLRIFNVVMGVLHFIQGSLVLFLSNDFTLPLTYTTPVFNEITQTISPVSETFFDIRIGPLVA